MARSLASILSDDFVDLEENFVLVGANVDIEDGRGLTGIVGGGDSDPVPLEVTTRVERSPGTVALDEYCGNSPNDPMCLPYNRELAVHSEVDESKPSIDQYAFISMIRFRWLITLLHNIQIGGETNHVTMIGKIKADAINHKEGADKMLALLNQERKYVKSALGELTTKTTTIAENKILLEEELMASAYKSSLIIKIVLVNIAVLLLMIAACAVWCKRYRRSGSYTIPNMGRAPGSASFSSRVGR